MITMNKKVVAIILGTMCFMLSVIIAMQYRIVKNANKVAGTNVNSELKTEVLKWKERYEEVYSVLEEAEKVLKEKREKAINNSDTSSELQQELRTLNSLIGSIDVKGQGIIIKIADNSNIITQTAGIFDNISNYLIHDMDLLVLVNELKNAGAEAISINGERIINTTSITCDGNVILINGNKISSPFEIKAIGSQEALLGAIQRPGGYLKQYLESYGLVSSIEKSDNITIYKYNGIIDYKLLED